MTVAIHDYPFGNSVGVAGTPPSGGPLRLELSPNPHGSLVRVRLAGLASSVASRGTLDVYDLEGRRVRRMSGDAAIGFLWDGRDDAGVIVAAGVYLHRVTTAAGSWTGRSVVVR